MRLLLGTASIVSSASFQKLVQQLQECKALPTASGTVGGTAHAWPVLQAHGANLWN